MRIIEIGPRSSTVTALIRSSSFQASLIGIVVDRRLIDSPRGRRFPEQDTHACDRPAAAAKPAIATGGGGQPVYMERQVLGGGIDLPQQRVLVQVAVIERIEHAAQLSCC